VDAAVLEEDSMGFELDAVDEDLEFFYTFFHFKVSVVRRELKELDPYFTCKTLLAHDTRVNKNLNCRDAVPYRRASII
jgi:hypothetical protein